MGQITLPLRVQQAIEFPKYRMGNGGKIMLFGSQARGTARPGGDFDLALIPPSGTTWEQFCVWKSEAGDIAWPYRIDIVDITRAPKDFLEVVKAGVCSSFE